MKRISFFGILVALLAHDVRSLGATDGTSATHKTAISSGVIIGEAAAIAVLAARTEDHRNDPELMGYSPGSGPGAWMPTPPAFMNPQTPFLQFDAVRV